MVDLRIPGRWAHPRDLIERLPDGCRLTPKALILPDGAGIDVGFMAPDDQFPGIFRSVCRRPPTEEELAAANGCTVNVTLSGNGGSMEAARTIMKAGAAIVRAGGAGVFIDNSALAHGGGLWLELAEDGGPDALSFAFVGIVQGDTGIWTVGMRVLGMRDIVLNRADVENGFDMVEVIRYVVRGDKPVGDGHILPDVNGPWFSCRAEGGDPRMVGTPLYNPFGCRVRKQEILRASGRPATIISVSRQSCAGESRYHSAYSSPTCSTMDRMGIEFRIRVTGSIGKARRQKADPPPRYS